jgi:hypothetical protein
MYVYNYVYIHICTQASELLGLVDDDVDEEEG